MIINGRQLAEVILSYCKQKIETLQNKNLKLAAIYVGKDANQLGYLKKKEQTAKKLNIKFELIHLKQAPSFEQFAKTLRDIAWNPENTGFIIQHPLPPALQTETIYNFIPNIKEIEGFARKSPFYPPIGLAVLTILKYIHLAKIYQDPKEKIQDIIIEPFIKEKYLKKIKKTKDIKTDRYFFKETFADKKIVLVGRGLTGGKPIGFVLNEFGINFINVNSSTPNPAQFFKTADIIITAVGKKVIKPEHLKEGVILINVGQRFENGKVKGDYDEEEIKNIASFYTPVIGGVGPLNIAYLYKNLVESAWLKENNVKI